ncbi:class I SAM-dependent methyltransferase [Neobacillus sp. D3-1R]|uniref:class I SAM-dependent methyltransferase n=1 Tax=Neobacillus sp. D3-1R TaxID=3445778 RepID=UPI003FA08A2B
MEIKKGVQEQFGRSAEAYVNSKIHKEGKDLQKLVEITAINGDEHVLDIATGGGHTANAFAPLVEKVVAVDLTKEMLIAAENFIRGNGHENVKFVEGDAEKLPFEAETFDIVTCRIAPHHFPNIEAFIKEVYRVLKTGGQFLLDDNVSPEDEELDQFYNIVEKTRDYSHYRAWKKTEWLKMLEFSGLNVYELHRFDKTFVYEQWCNRMHLPENEKEKLNQYMIHSSQQVKDHFKVKMEGDKVISFQGEAVVIKAVK